MHLEGAHFIDAPQEAVWALLLDPKVLAKVIPGVKKLEQVGIDKYITASQVKMGPVNGLFNGEMHVLDKKEPESFKLKMIMNSRIGNVDALGKLTLKVHGENQTEVTFSGEAKLSGTIVRTGQRLLNSVAKTMTKQFFKSLDKEVNALKGDNSSERTTIFKKKSGT